MNVEELNPGEQENMFKVLAFVIHSVWAVTVVTFNQLIIWCIEKLISVYVFMNI